MTLITWNNRHVCKEKETGQNIYSQERFDLFTIIILHLQQPAVASLPQEGGGVRVFTAVTAHV